MHSSKLYISKNCASELGIIVVKTTTIKENNRHSLEIVQMAVLALGTRLHVVFRKRSFGLSAFKRNSEHILIPTHIMQ